MTQSTVFQLTPIAKSPSTCATCPFFSDFNGRERGLCQVFEKVFKKQNFRTSDCDLQIESLLKQPKTSTVEVELITEAVEDDGSGHAVPLDSRTVQVNVAQPLKALVESAIAAQKNLQGWQVATFWQSDPNGEFEL